MDILISKKIGFKAEAISGYFLINILIVKTVRF